MREAEWDCCGYPFVSRLPHFKGAFGNEHQKLATTTNAPKGDYENIVGRPSVQKPFKIFPTLNEVQDASVNKTLDSGNDVLHPCAPPNLRAPPISESEQAEPKAPCTHRDASIRPRNAESRVIEANDTGLSDNREKKPSFEGEVGFGLAGVPALLRVSSFQNRLSKTSPESVTKLP
jgi:hypothetical protein